MKHLHDLHCLVLGLGDSGLAMVRWCAAHGAQVVVWDSRDEPPHAAVLAAELPRVRRLSGVLDSSALDGVHLVLKSPGLSPLDPKLQPLLAQARATGVLVQGELELFVRALADLKADRGYAPKLIAITGTNGKTTTTAMTAQLIERTGRTVVVAGNIGPTMLDTLAGLLTPPLGMVAGDDPHPHPLPPAGEGAELRDTHEPAPLPSGERLGGGRADGLAASPPPPQPSPSGGGGDSDETRATLPAVWVLELSSFQLDDVDGFAPDAATVLNITEDHLDWHGSMDAYVAAKARIQGPADAATVLVVNRDDPRVEAMVPAPTAAKARFAKPVPRQVVRFGLDAPHLPGDFGLVTENGMAWLVRALEADVTERRGRKGTTLEPEELHIQRLMPADALRVRGRHNAANALAALALATAIGCPLAPMLHGLRDYTGEPHRVQFVTSVGEVEAYDDSKGTNVGATVAAVNGLGSDRAPARLAVILGGDGKGQDFGPLAEPLQRHARAVATLGRDAAAVEAAIGAAMAASGIALQRHDTLEAATAWCFAQARPGDAVLLSPACASLDMFRNYAHRAEVFVDAVQRLAADAGEMTA